MIVTQPQSTITISRRIAIVILAAIIVSLFRRCGLAIVISVIWSFLSLFATLFASQFATWFAICLNIWTYIMHCITCSLTCSISSCGQGFRVTGKSSWVIRCITEGSYRSWIGYRLVTDESHIGHTWFNDGSHMSHRIGYNGITDELYMGHGLH